MSHSREAPRLENGERAVRPDPRPLGAVAAAVTLAATTGLLPRWSGLVHLVALPPLDIVADLGVLLVHAPSYPWFVAGALVSFAVRVVVLAGLTGGISRGHLVRAACFLAIVWPFALITAGVRYSAPAVLFYLLFWIGLLLTLVLVALTAAVPFQPVVRLREAFGRSWRAGLRLGTVFAYLALLTMLGAIADTAGPVAGVAVVPLGALATWTTALVLQQPARWRIGRRALAAVPAAGLALVAVVVVRGPGEPPTSGAPDEPDDGSLLLMSGIDSSSGSGAILEIDPHVAGFGCEQTFYFSYAGPGDGQPQNDARCPIRTGAPYEPEDSLRSREELVPFFEAQVDGLPQPVTAAVHSQGVWIAWEAAASGRAPGLDTLVLVGPLLTNPVSFPVDPDARTPGRVGADVVRLLTDVPRPGGAAILDVDAPLVEEWLATPDRIETTLAMPLPDEIRVVSVPSVFDLPLLPSDPTLAGADDACPIPVTHPNLPYAREFLAVVDRAAAGQPLPQCPPWRSIVGPLFRPYNVPPT
jgi:hypothetical protein